MKKKLLTLMFTLALLIGLVAAMGMNASAADVTCTANGNIYEVNDGDNLRYYLFNADDGDTIRLTSDIVFQNASGNFEIEPMFNSSKGGNVILDLNGYGLYVAAKNSYLFDLAEVQDVSLHIVDNDPMYEGWIQFISPQAGSSVFYLGSSNNELYIYEGVGITMGKDNTAVTGSQATYIINASSYGEIGIHGAYLQNLYTNGAGLYFNNNTIGVRNSKVYIDGGTEIKTNSSCIDLHNSPYYPDFQIGAAILDGNNAVEVVDDNQYANTTETALKFKDLLQDGYNLYMVGGGSVDNMNNASLLNNNDTEDCHIYKGSYANTCTTHANKKDIFIHAGGHVTQCTDCGYFAGTTLHTQVKVREATCTEKGYSTAGYDCACGRVTATVIPALNHDYVDIAQKEETCTENGFKFNLKYCKHCETYFRTNGDSISEAQWNMIYLEPCHKMAIVRAVAATCTTNGNIAHYACSRCSHISSDSEGKNAIKSAVVKANGHKYTNACDTSCNTCKATRKITHSYKSATTKATFANSGKIENKCSVCGNVKSTTAIRYVKTATLSTTSYTYDGAVKTPSVTVKDANGKTLKNGTDYTVTYASGRKTVGTYKVTVTLKGNYSGTKTLTFKINPISISKCTVKLSATSYTYNGSVKTPSVIVKSPKGTTLTKGTHYTVTYASGRKSVGAYKVTITMKGNYSGTKTLTFYVLPSKTSKITPTATTTTLKATWNKVTGASGYRVELLNASGKVLKKVTTSKLTYTFSGLSAGTTYKVRVSAYKTISGTNKYSLSSTTLTTATKPATPTLKVSSTTKGKASLSWTNVAGETGYQVYYSTNNKTFTKIASYTTNTVKASKSKLTSGKTYYFKVRSYKKVGNTVVYGGWSSVKSIKIK